jgi:poly(3-hydroxybutyrate) depolymerase
MRSPRSQHRTAWVTLPGLVALSLALPAMAARLPMLDVDLQQTTVSGVSSGGFMAVQLHLAHSSIVSGVGVFAGGPYDCAMNSAERAVQVCMPGGADADASIARVGAAFRAGDIDDPANLGDDRVWLYSGYNDGVVKQDTMDALHAFYRHFTADGGIYYRDNAQAGHAFVTPDVGDSCAVTGGNYINDCDYDGAGALLQHLYGRLQPGAGDGRAGRFVAFELGEFTDGDPRRSGLAETGYLYVPAACAEGARCRVHVAFHGCLQEAGRIGDAFYRHAGYNPWADANRLIVLYPQVVTTHLGPFNPRGCWDWWGYTDRHYATRRGRQVAAVRAMLGRLAGRADGSVVGVQDESAFGPPAGLTGIDSADDAASLAWRAVAGARGYNLYRADEPGTSFVRVNDAPVTDTSYGDSGLAPETAYLYAVTALGPGGESARTGPVRVVTGPPAPPCDPYFADNVTHVRAGRAQVFWGLTYAKGSNDAMGWWNIFTETNLYRDGDGFRVGTCPARPD